MEIEAEAESLEREIEQLERGVSALIAWTALDQRLASLMLSGQNQLATLQRALVEHVRNAQAYAWVRTHKEVRDVAELIERVRVLRMRVQSRIYEHQITAQQTTYMQFK